MSGNSIFSPGFEGDHKVGKQGTGTSKAGTGETSIVIELDKELLTKEHYLHVKATQARTTPATSCDVRKVFKSVVLNLTGGPNSGDRFSMSGHVADALFRLTEEQPNPEIDLTNGTAEYLIGLHHLLDGSHLDLISAVRMGLYTGARLTLVLNGTDNQLFTGGTAAGNVDVEVDVKARDYQSILQLDHFEKIGTFSNHCVGNSYNVNGTGAQNPIDVECGIQRNRFVILCAFDNTGAPSDGVIGDVSFTVGSVKREYSFKELRRATVNKRGVDQVGLVVIDMGDNPANFTPANVKKAKIEWTALAAGRLEVAPAFIKPLTE